MLVGFTAIISVTMTRAVFPGCPSVQEHWPEGFEKDRQYMDAFETHEVPEKNVRVLKTLMTGRCYVVPMVEQKVEEKMN